MEEKCFNCERSDDEVILLDAIYGREILKVCRKCSLNENIILLGKPSNFQLKESEKPPTVYERLSRMAGLPVKKQEKKGEQDYEKIEWKPESSLQLIDNFHWYIQMARRKKGLSKAKIAEAIAESEETMKLIEDGNLPENSDRVIRKIEQFLNIRLRKGGKTGMRTIKEQQETRPEPARILKFNGSSIENLTIADLRKMKEEREKIKEIEKELKEIEEKEKEWKGLTKEEREEIREQEEERKEAREKESE